MTFKLLFDFVEVVDLVLLSGEISLSLLDRLFESLLVLAQLACVLVLLGELTVQGLDLVVLGLFVLLSLDISGKIELSMVRQDEKIKSLINLARTLAIEKIFESNILNNKKLSCIEMCFNRASTYS